MHEKLDETLASMDEKIAKIIESDITRLESLVTAGNFPDDDKVHDITIRMGRIGDALKSLADGLESYRAITSTIKKDANPRKMTSASPVVGGQIR